VYPRTRVLEWVRAGHEPAYLYRPIEDRFEALQGRGMALGIALETSYEVNRTQADPGEILVLTTDGIFETRARGQMFGRERFLEVIRSSHHLSAPDIRNAVFKALDDFRGHSAQEDDVTLVVVKFAGT
jgi:phosphoserine phosphatase RsbU/P